MCYNLRRMEIHYLKRITISLPSQARAGQREWLWRMRRTAPVLIALLMLMLLGQLGGQLGCSFATGLPVTTCPFDGTHIEVTFVHAQEPGSETPTPSMPGPSQSHEMHHSHCQFAVLLIISAIVPLLVVLGIKAAPRQALLHINFTPPSPPPRFADL